MRRLLLVLAAILALVLGYLQMRKPSGETGSGTVSPALPGQAASLKSGEFSPAGPAPDFTLDGSHGRPLKLSDHRGKVVALGFGFTSCPQICPTTLLELAEARKKLGADGADFQVIYVTVDPANDTAARMRDYVTGFDPSFLGATGSASQLDAVRKLYGATASEVKGPDGKVLGFNHTSSVFLIDRGGKLRSMSPYGRSVDDLVHDVRILLKG
jgi:protein SCO1